MKNAREYGEVRILDRPKRRLDAMIDLRTELLEMTDGFYEGVQKVTERVMSEVYDADEDEGLLEIQVEKYMSCLNVDIAELDKLLVEEIKQKKDDLQSAERQANKLITEMQQVIDKNDS